LALFYCLIFLIQMKNTFFLNEVVESLIFWNIFYVCKKRFLFLDFTIFSY